MSSFGVEPSEGHHTWLSILENYPAQASRLSGHEQKKIREAARELYRTSPSDALSYLAGTRGYTNFRPDAFMAQLITKPVNYNNKKFERISTAAFEDLLSRSPTEQEINKYTNLAKAEGIKDYGAFESFLSNRLASTEEGRRKILTEADREWESKYGTIQRNPETGELQRGMVDFDPERFASIAKNLGSIFSSAM